MEQVRKRLLPVVWATLALVAACVTVNIYFPAAEVEETAKKIVDDVYQEKGKKQSEQPESRLPEGSQQSSSRFAWLGPRTAHAAEATTVSNAAIRALKEQIGQRHKQLLPYYGKGQVGIDKNGYLEVRDTAGLALPQVASLKRLVEADNSARRRLYQEVARALDLQPQQVDDVQKIFAKEWRSKAQPGWWTQDDAGKWSPK